LNGLAKSQDGHPSAVAGMLFTGCDPIAVERRPRQPETLEAPVPPLPVLQSNE